MHFLGKKNSSSKISQEQIILGKKQRVDINWQKIPYIKGLVYFSSKINGFTTVGILIKKIAKISQFFFTKSLIKPLITVFLKSGAEDKSCGGNFLLP